jgi:hypothetical protein
MTEVTQKSRQMDLARRSEADPTLGERIGAAAGHWPHQSGEGLTLRGGFILLASAPEGSETLIYWIKTLVRAL